MYIEIISKYLSILSFLLCTHKPILIESCPSFLNPIKSIFDLLILAIQVMIGYTISTDTITGQCSAFSFYRGSNYAAEFWLAGDWGIVTDGL